MPFLHVLSFFSPVLLFSEPFFKKQKQNGRIKSLQNSTRNIQVEVFMWLVSTISTSKAIMEKFSYNYSIKYCCIHYGLKIHTLMAFFFKFTFLMHHYSCYGHVRVLFFGFFNGLRQCLQCQKNGITMAN